MKPTTNIRRMRKEREDATRSARSRRESSDRRALRRFAQQTRARAVDAWSTFEVQA